MEKEVKAENKLPKTMDEFYKKFNDFDRDTFFWNAVHTSNAISFYFDIAKENNTLTKTEAHNFLVHLHILRNEYRKGWIPNWNDDNPKWCIIVENDELTICKNTRVQRFLSFQSEELAKEFLANFKNIIERAKELI